jgi:hypothetical protein
VTRDAAIGAARRGWTVFPCRPGDKRPAFPDHSEGHCNGTDPRCRNGHTRWEARATTDEARICRAWDRIAWNIGIACGPSGLVVVDLDTHDELPEDWRTLPGVVDGRDVLAQICEWAGMPWPSTYTVRTTSGGWHLYYTALPGTEIRNSAGLIGPQVDVRAAGGYVIGAGSVVDGKTYEVIDDSAPVPLPGWLARLITTRPEDRQGAASSPVRGLPGSRINGLVEKVRASRPGDRTGPLVWAAHRLREMAAAGQADPAGDGERLIQAAVDAGIRGGERYARQQVRHVLGGAR